MAKTADIIAIYSRKSRYTGKGESIGNQIDLCREYIRTHYGDAAAQQAVVFEDEGFSGGNLNRPDFKKMMTAAKERKIRAIVVYRLDRISRNISDFSSLIEELGRLGIDFVSIRESFDTSSPMGRAMMYIMARPMGLEVSKLSRMDTKSMPSRPSSSIRLEKSLMLRLMRSRR